LIAQTEHARTSLRLDDVAGRYWMEHGQYLAGTNLWGWLGLVLEHFGKDKLVTDITDDEVAQFVARQRARRRKDGALVSPHTVNHAIMTLRRLFTRCKSWGVRFAHEPKWSKRMLSVPTERVRELSDDEADKLDAVMRDDYAPFFEFARVTGWRLNECLLQWSEVQWTTGQIVKLGKGGKRIARRITSDVRDILWPLRGHHPESVFTYVCERGEHGRVNGERYPITYAGVQTYWRRLRKRSGVVGFRIHDFRHDFATKLLRQERDIRLVQKALGHASVKTTERYAHVHEEEVAAALERAAKLRTKPAKRLKAV